MKIRTARIALSFALRWSCSSLTWPFLQIQLLFRAESWASSWWWKKRQNVHELYNEIYQNNVPDSENMQWKWITRDELKELYYCACFLNTQNSIYLGHFDFYPQQTLWIEVLLKGNHHCNFCCWVHFRVAVWVIHAFKYKNTAFKNLTSWREIL